MADKPASQRSVDLLKKELGAVESRLDGKIDRVAAATVKLQADVAEIKGAMVTKDDFKRILGYLDAFSGQLLGYGRETDTFPVLLDEHAKTLKDHTKRIGALENRR